MFNKLKARREALTDKYFASKGLEKGFTLMEVMFTILIIIVLIGIMVVAFNVFGRVDGTELNAQSKNIESAALQTALSDTTGIPREMPGKDTHDLAASAKQTAPVAFDGTAFFDDYSSAKHVLYAMAAKGFPHITDKEEQLKALEGLLAPVEADVQKSVAGDAKVTNYVVVVKKSQLYTDAAPVYEKYNDNLAGTVFSKLTIKDNDEFFYNGTNKAKAATK